MKNGATVAAFEREFAAYVGARYAIALVNGTATLHTALAALGVKPGDRVAVPPLTMSATTMAVLHAGAVPLFIDVEPDTWTMQDGGPAASAWMPVALYGLWGPLAAPKVIEDAAQTLRQHDGAAFTSYSFQASKILSTGEGGMLVTNSEHLATKAREFSSLGYRMRADQPRIDPVTLKSPTFDRHHTFPAFNYRMNDVTATEGLRQLGKVGGLSFTYADQALEQRRCCAQMYEFALLAGCDWITPQHVPEGYTHDYWTFALACDTPERALWLSDAIVTHGGERPYAAWKLTYMEPAFRQLAPTGERIHSMRLDRGPRGGAKVVDLGTFREPACPNAESLQPRLLQFQTNDLASAERNANALRRAISDAKA